jgi:hypothetical protein
LLLPSSGQRLGSCMAGLSSRLPASSKATVAEQALVA